MGGCSAIGACSGRRHRSCPWFVTDYLCVCSLVCGYGCEDVRASVHPVGDRRGARVRVGGNTAISPASELSSHDSHLNGKDDRGEEKMGCLLD